MRDFHTNHQKIIAFVRMRAEHRYGTRVLQSIASDVQRTHFFVVNVRMFVNVYSTELSTAFNVFSGTRKEQFAAATFQTSSKET